MKLKEAKNLQNAFKSSRERFKSEEEKSALATITLLYKSRAVIKLFNDYSSIVCEAKYKSILGEGLKILTPKQMLQRLPIAFAQVKSVNTSENVLNDIR